MIPNKATSAGKNKGSTRASGDDPGKDDKKMAEEVFYPRKRG